LLPARDGPVTDRLTACSQHCETWRLANGTTFRVSPMTTISPHLHLQRTPSGWVLTDEHGETVFEAEGRDGRRQCLAHASESGALRITFDEQRAQPVRRRPSQQTIKLVRRAGPPPGRLDPQHRS
jgi:hypothetical protein